MNNKFIMQNGVVINIEQIVRVDAISHTMYRSRITMSDGSHVDTANKIDWLLLYLNGDMVK